MTLLLKGTTFFDRDFPVFVNLEFEAFDTGKHQHDFVELSLIVEGRGYHYINENLVQVRKGDLFVLPIGTSHVFRPTTSDVKDNPLVVMNLIFDLKALEPIKQWFPEESALYQSLYSPDDRAWSQYHDENGQILSLFQTAYMEYARQSDGYRLIITSLLMQMLQLLLRMKSEDRPSSGTETHSDVQIKDILHFIEQHYSDKITLKSLSERFYMSAGHFQSEFKRVTGQTFNQYLQNTRIQKCCQLLKTTDKSVQETANEVGYSDMKFFHSLFRRITGNSPHQYRKYVYETHTSA